MKTYVLLADGFEIAEAMLPIDMLKRARIEVVTLSISSQLVVTASCGIPVVADALLSETDLNDGDLLFLPGGMPGTTNLRNSPLVTDTILTYFKAGKWLGAICAAPSAFGVLGILKGQEATCYPGFEKDLLGATPLKKTCVRSGQFITGCGAGAAFQVGRELVAVLVGEDTADAVLRQMMFEVYE
ncbi:MAG: DJ-1/PfpI family protein [Bacteroidales bacterium]|nr:DJ-1/PfpI family protein [Bacteroidales bacterium]